MSANTKYPNTSPWASTKITKTYLDILQIRPVAAEQDDYLYTIEPQYTYRPDLLAFDLYGTSKLWWVFSQRNLDVIQDPVFDFIPGTQIFIPKRSGLLSTLGI
jgi:alpha-L-fucosidase